MNVSAVKYGVVSLTLCSLNAFVNILTFKYVDVSLISCGLECVCEYTNYRIRCCLPQLCS